MSNVRGAMAPGAAQRRGPIMHDRRASPGRTVWLRQIYIVASADIHKFIPGAAPRAGEVTSSFVDLRINGAKHDFQPTAYAFPHSGLRAMFKHTPPTRLAQEIFMERAE